MYIKSIDLLTWPMWEEMITTAVRKTLERLQAQWSVFVDQFKW